MENVDLSVESENNNEEVDQKELPVGEERQIGVDEFLNMSGEFGRFQIIYLLVLTVIAIPVSFPVMIFYYIGHSPSWACTSSDNMSHSTGFNNVCSGPANKTFSYDQSDRCDLQRHEWYYYTNKTTIVTEYDLVCDKACLDALAGSIIFVGWGVGSVLSGLLSDRYGRKKVAIPFMLGVQIFMALHAAASNIWLLLMFRFCLGLCFAAPALNFHVLVVEIVGPSKRPLATNLLASLTWPCGALLLTLKAYYIDNWRILALVCSLPYIILLILGCFLPESVRWLNSKGRTKEAENILRRVARVNKKCLPVVSLKPCEEINEELPTTKKKYSYIDLFKRWHIAKIVIVQSFLWFTAGMVYYGLSWAFADLGGDMYISFLLSLFIEIPGNMFNIYILKRVGRRIPTIAMTFICGCCCLVIAFLPPHDQKYKVARLVFGLTAKFMIANVFGCIYLWSTEIYPTVVRSQAMSIKIVSSRVGSAMSPFIKVLDQIHPAASFGLMGTACIISALISLVLPETRNMPTREEFDDFYPKVSTVEMRAVFDGNQVELNNGTVIFHPDKSPGHYEEDEEDADDKPLLANCYP